MSAGVEYDDEFDYHEGSPAQLAARRTRRRRRHGKKQGSPEAGLPVPSEDGRGRWLPPASATTLTLAQLGIHLPAKDSQTLTLERLGIPMEPAPPPPPKCWADACSRNVVTWSDLELMGSSTAQTSTSAAQGHATQPGPLASAAQGFPDARTLPPPLPPQVITSAPHWHCVEERPYDRILSVPSPQVAMSVGDGMAMPHYPVVPPRPQNQHSHIQAVHQAAAGAWRADTDPALQHWLCAGQYGAQPIFHTPLCDGNGMPLAAAQVTTSVASAPLGGPQVPLEMEPVATFNAKPASTEAMSESDKLDTLLQELASEAYQD